MYTEFVFTLAITLLILPLVSSDLMPIPLFIVIWPVMLPPLNFKYPFSDSVVPVLTASMASDTAFTVGA